VSVLASEEDCTGNVTVVVAAMEGLENGEIPLKLAAAPRVSIKRQGVIAMNVRALVETAFEEKTSCGGGLPVDSRSIGLGCRHKGLAQFLRGITFDAT
jgi:hypothetical protein